jgi:choline kinase
VTEIGFNRSIRVLILAAGEGSRLRPYTIDRPKCMVIIDQKSLLERQLEVLNSRNLNDVTLIGGYLSSALKVFGLPLIVNDQFSETNMLWSLFCAEEEMVNDIIVSYGDIVYSPDALDSLLDSNADISVVIDTNWYEYWAARSETPLLDAETLRMDATGRILEIGQRPTTISSIQGQYIGLMRFNKSGIEMLKSVFKEVKQNGIFQGKRVEKAHMTDLLQELVERDVPVKAIPTEAPWVEVDTVEDKLNPITLERLSSIEWSMRR